MTAPVQLALEDPQACQRWWYRRHSWRRTSDGGFNPAAFQVRAIPQAPARAFVEQHHYSNSWPPMRLQYGLFLTDPAAQPGVPGGPDALVGVLGLGIPMHPGVLRQVFEHLVVYQESLELSRLVLVDPVPANGETWFLAQALRLAAERGIRGIVAHSDPHPRTRQTDHGPELVMPGHVGTCYQAGGMEYLGRIRPRRLVVLPDATVLSDRVMAKVRRDDVGHRRVQRRLVALGAPSRGEGEPGARWLERALEAIGAQRLDHGGNHRYALPIGPRRSRRIITVTSYTYPKKHDSSGAAAPGRPGRDA